MAHPSWGAPCSGEKQTVIRSDGVKLPVRAELAPLVAMLCDETERLMYNLVPGWCWGIACRKIRGRNAWSNHAWGLAIDINAPENPMGPRTGKIRQHPKVIALWKKYGFRWGGDYTGRADDMHFEFLGSKDDAAFQTRRARQDLQGGPSTPPQTVIVHDPSDRPYPGYAGKYGGYNRIEFEDHFDGNVQYIQARLNKTNLEPKLWVDGFFGEKTEAAVRGFQGARKLKVDGVFGRNSWNELNGITSG